MMRYIHEPVCCIDYDHFTDWAVQVVKTQRAIKHTLTERYYTWQDAVDVAKEDPEINFEGGEGQMFNPSAYEDEEDVVQNWPEPGQEATSPSTEATQPGTAPVEGEAHVSKNEREATR